MKGTRTAGYFRTVQRVWAAIQAGCVEDDCIMTHSNLYSRTTLWRCKRELVEAGFLYNPKPGQRKNNWAIVPGMENAVYWSEGKTNGMATIRG
jgi:hypothetical protein